MASGSEPSTRDAHALEDSQPALRNVYAVAVGLVVILGLAVAGIILRRVPDAPQTPPPSSESSISSHEANASTVVARDSCQDDPAKARINAASLLDAIFKKEGRLISVTAVGENCQVLQLSSGLMGDETYTLQAAERETIECDYCMLLYRKLHFKQITFVGIDWKREYHIK